MTNKDAHNLFLSLKDTNNFLPEQTIQTLKKEYDDLQENIRELCMLGRLVHTVNGYLVKY